jgi:hypothetical protein
LWRNLTDRRERWVNRQAVNWGTTLESVALAAYELETGLIVGRDGFCAHPDHDWLGGSPDGIVFDPSEFSPGGSGLLEIKCPFSQELWDEPPAYYVPQIQGLMQIKRLPWCDFVCWTPFGMRVWRVKRSESYWEWMAPKLAEFWTYVEFDIEPPGFKRGEKEKFTTFNGQLEINRWLH